MITCIFGLPGSGKSTLLAKIARQNLRRGVKVYSNFYIKGCYTLDFDRLGVDDYSDCVMLIDEISLFCDSRDWKKFSAAAKYFFTNHRHFNVRIYVCSQSYLDMDSKIRNITDELYHITEGFCGLSRVRPVRKVLTVDNGKVSEYYEERGLGRFFRRSKYYDMFDSFVKRELPPNTEIPWNTESKNE